MCKSPKFNIFVKGLLVKVLLLSPEVVMRQSLWDRFIQKVTEILGKFQSLSV